MHLMKSGETGGVGQARNTGSRQDATRVSGERQQLAGGRGARVVPRRASRIDLRLSAQNGPPGRPQNLLAKPPPSR
jgi:hypothetical protein